MAAKRRRLISAFAAVVIIVLWLQYGESARSSTGVTPYTKTHTESEGEVFPGPVEVVTAVERAKDGEIYPLSSIMSLPSGKPAVIPRVQFSFSPEHIESSQLRKERLASVKEAFVHSWNGYRKHAWLKDEVAPVTGGYRTTFSGWAASLVDSLDTLWLLGMHEEFHEAVNAAASINFHTPASLPVNVFETTIRYLGGFLGAYDISEGHYPILLEKAREVGEMLFLAFDTPNRMPVTRWSKLGVEVAAGDALVAEIGSLSLEFTRLSQLTGDPKYFDAVQRIANHLSDQQMKTKIPGLFPETVNARDADFTGNTVFSIGGQTDSVYEYFPKQYLMLGGRSYQHKELYKNAISAMKEFILFRPMTPSNEAIVLAGTVHALNPAKIEFDPHMQHLSCFAGGMFALAAKIFECPEDVQLAALLTEGCIWAGQSTALGITPESFHMVPCPGGLLDTCLWNEDAWADDMFRRNTNDDRNGEKQLPKQQRIQLKQERLRLPTGMSAIASRKYLLRPEIIESIFVMYRVTGDGHWREYAWDMFKSITNHTRTDIAFSGLDDVTSNASRHTDKMESFWLAESLKYFYLTFSEPEVLSLDKFVFNTEAHPFRRPQ